MKHFLLPFLFLFSIVTQARTTLSPSPFRGCWKEVGPQTRHHAFLEHLGVCGDDTPAYTSVQLKGNRAILTFQQQGKPVALKPTFKVRHLTHYRPEALPDKTYWASRFTALGFAVTREALFVSVVS